MAEIFLIVLIVFIMVNDIHLENNAKLKKERETYLDIDGDDLLSFQNEHQSKIVVQGDNAKH